MEIACPASTPDEPLDDERAEAIADGLRALSDPTRVKLVHRIASAGDDGVCVCDLTEPLGISQPSVSYHLRILRDAGLVDRRRKATFAFYSIRSTELEYLAEFLVPVTTAAP
jgi:ArsR family transcriptional regulator